MNSRLKKERTEQERLVLIFTKEKVAPKHLMVPTCAGFVKF